ncbi:MAG TPA: AI-2E family transporter [Candidatus Atribacteria bacterium]|nr:AI-2E family transporter [Candidatus Atribacteria bacterium]
MELDRKNIRRILAIIIISIIIYLGLSNISSVIGVLLKGMGIVTPLLLGAALAFILNVPMRLIERLIFPRSKKPLIIRVRRPLAILITYVLFFAVLAMVLFLLIPQLVNTVSILSAAIPAAYLNIEKWVIEKAQEIPQLQEWLSLIKLDWQSIGNSLADVLKKGSSVILGSTVYIIRSILSGTMTFVLALVFSIYALAGKERLRSQVERILKAFLPREKAERTLEIGALVNKTFTGFVTGQLTEAAILSMLCFIGMLIFGFPFAPMISVLLGFTALIPLIGPIIGVGIGAFMIFMISPVKAFWFIVFIIVLQQLEGNLIYPRVMGSSVGLPAIWVIAAVTIGGSFMGITGMLLSVPVSAVLYALFREAVRSRLHKSKEDTPIDKGDVT